MHEQMNCADCLGPSNFKHWGSKLNENMKDNLKYIVIDKIVKAPPKISNFICKYKF